MLGRVWRAGGGSWSFGTRATDEETLKEAVSSGQARIGFLLPEDVGTLFEAYGSQKTKNLSAGVFNQL